MSLLHGASRLVPLFYLRGWSLRACFGINNTNRSYGRSETSVAVTDRKLTDCTDSGCAQMVTTTRGGGGKNTNFLTSNFFLNEPTKDVTVMLTTGNSWLLNFSVMAEIFISTLTFTLLTWKIW